IASARSRRPPTRRSSTTRALVHGAGWPATTGCAATLTSRTRWPPHPTARWCSSRATATPAAPIRTWRRSHTRPDARAAPDARATKTAPRRLPGRLVPSRLRGQDLRAFGVHGDAHQREPNDLSDRAREVRNDSERPRRRRLPGHPRDRPERGHRVVGAELAGG